MSEKVEVSMLQVYPFHGTDVQDIYEKLNTFLDELNTFNVQVPLDHIRTNTKYYPDYDRTATTIEVCIDFSDWHVPSEGVSHFRDVHRAIVNGSPETTADEPENAVAEAYRLVREAGPQYVLDLNSEGYFLTNTGDQGHVFWGVQRDEVLAWVQRVLGIQPAVTVPASDDFDPFLDGDDLP